MFIIKCIDIRIGNRVGQYVTQSGKTGLITHLQVLRNAGLSI